MLKNLTTTEKKALAQITLASFCFGFLGIFGKLAFQNGLTTGILLTARFSLAASLLGLYLILFSPQSLKIGWRQFAIASLQGILGYAVFSTLYFRSLEGISVSLAAMLLFTYPLWIAVIHALAGGPIRRNQWIILGVAFFGLVTLLWGQIEVHSMIAFLCGLGSGITYAIYIFISGKIQRQVHPLASSFYVILWCAIALAIFHHPSDQNWKQVFMSFNPKQGLIILGLALGTTIIPLTLVLSSLQKLPSPFVALVSMLEPVVAALAGWLILQEALNWNQMLGSLIVLGAVLAQVRFSPQDAAEPAQA